MFWIKLNQILNGLVVALIMLWMFQGSLSIPLSGQPGSISIGGQAKRVATSTEELLFTLVFVGIIILVGEIARGWIRQSFTLDEKKFANSPQSVWATMGTVDLVKSLIGTPLILFFLLVVNIVSFYFLVTSIATPTDALPL